MKLALRWALICSASMLLSTARVAGQQPGAIRGTITDQSTSAPLSGATVRIQGTALSAPTNARGLFAITGVPPGDHALTAALIGYRPTTKQVTVSPGETVE